MRSVWTLWNRTLYHLRGPFITRLWSPHDQSNATSNCKYSSPLYLQSIESFNVFNKFSNGSFFQCLANLSIHLSVFNTLNAIEPNFKSSFWRHHRVRLCKIALKRSIRNIRSDANCGTLSMILGVWYWWVLWIVGEMVLKSERKSRTCSVSEAGKQSLLEMIIENPLIYLLRKYPFYNWISASDDSLLAIVCCTSMRLNSIQIRFNNRAIAVLIG